MRNYTESACDEKRQNPTQCSLVTVRLAVWFNGVCTSILGLVIDNVV